GDAAEASLAEALQVIRTGQCSAPVADLQPQRRRMTRVEPLERASGLQQVIGAH
ncbi:MAG: hypothetical protein H0V80_08105, partial [Acidobacteria bacterium]|nr:hypothetical protein [Acidobacteriota bacterium]